MPFGRPARSLTVEAGAQPECTVECDAAAWVAAEVTDEAGKPAPCKVRFNGRNGTPDPLFFPETGGPLVRNLVYTPNGRFRQVLPPGEYDVTISRGPEYDLATRAITVAAGRETALKATLPRVLDTRGWISASFANYTAASRQFTSASPEGRVLNLAAEHIEFAPSTDMDTISDLAPALKRMSAEALVATCPGVRLNWAGRKYAERFHAAFPLVHQRGRMDGGMIQRPQHVSMRTWLDRWNPAGEKAYLIDEPWSDRIFVEDVDGDYEPDNLVDVCASEIIEVHSLLPLALPEGRLPPDLSRRVLDWMTGLRLGYRLRGVVDNDEVDDFHGQARWRNYVQSPTDDPAQIKPLDVARALREGRSIMSSGPFLRVELAAEGADGKRAGPGDVLACPAGKATLHVEAQAPDWIDLDAVAVWVNGRPDPALGASRSAQPDRFAAAPMQFRSAIPMQFSDDSFVVVVVSGAGTNAAPRGTNAPARVPHVAVSNPIWVRGPESGRRATPTEGRWWPVALGGARNVGSMWQERPVSIQSNAPVGLVRMPIYSRTDRTFQGTLSFRARPEGAVRFLGGEQRTFKTTTRQYQGKAKQFEYDAARMVNNRLDFTLKPLGIPQAGSGRLFLIEVELTGSGRDGALRSASVFGSTRPRTDNTLFGSINGNQERESHY